MQDQCRDLRGLTVGRTKTTAFRCFMGAWRAVSASCAAPRNARQATGHETTCDRRAPYQQRCLRKESPASKPDSIGAPAPDRRGARPGTPRAAECWSGSRPCSPSPSGVPRVQTKRTRKRNHSSAVSERAATECHGMLCYTRADQPAHRSMGEPLPSRFCQCLRQPQRAKHIADSTVGGQRVAPCRRPE